MTLRAITYARWSRHEQGQGTTAARQHELTTDYCARQGWEVAEHVTDDGISAWTGDNIKTGNLARLVERLERDGGSGTVIVVEKLDRLSRQAPLTMTNWLQRACATGVMIATVDGRHLITAHSLMSQPIVLMSVIFESFRGFDESQAKSDRVAEAWAKKRERGAPMTRLCPAWLRIAADATSYRSSANTSARYEVIEDRAAIVHDIFDWTEAGLGKSAIAARLNREGVAVWGRGDGWHASYVQKILRNPAVIGEHQPHTKPRGGQRKPVGEPIRDYFPAIITVEQFERVNDRRATAVLAQQSGYNRLGNLFAGIAQCGACGGSMTFLNKGVETLADGRLAERTYIKCSRAHRQAKGCDHRRSHSYPDAERAVLDELLHLAMDDQHFSSADSVRGLEGDVARLRRELADADRRRATAYDAMEDDADDEFAAQRYRQRRDEAKAAKRALEAAEAALIDARGAVSPAEHIARVSDVREMMNSADEDERYKARSRVKLALNDLIDRVTFDQNGKVIVQVKEGLRTIVVRPAGEVWNFDLVHPSRERVSNDPAVKAYLRRAAS